jgi:hypothetical protein
VLLIIRMGGGWADQNRPVKLIKTVDKGHYFEYQFAEYDSEENEWCDYEYKSAYGNEDLMESFIID